MWQAQQQMHFCSISCGMAMASLGQKETQVNFLLRPSATQFTEFLQPTPQRIPHAPYKGKVPVKGHQGKVIKEKNLENLNSADRSSRKKEQKLQ